MLVLTRKIDQRIVIGENITVAVLGVQRGEIRLGFKAPDGETILREELGSEDRLHKLHEKTEGMLILIRKVGQCVVIDKNITVRVLGKNKGRVKVGIDAPHDVKVNREERLDESRVHGSIERF